MFSTCKIRKKQLYHLNQYSSRQRTPWDNNRMQKALFMYWVCMFTENPSLLRQTILLLSATTQSTHFMQQETSRSSSDLASDYQNKFWKIINLCNALKGHLHLAFLWIPGVKANTGLGWNKACLGKATDGAELCSWVSTGLGPHHCSVTRVLCDLACYSFSEFESSYVWNRQTDRSIP